MEVNLKSSTLRIPLQTLCVSIICFVTDFDFSIGLPVVRQAAAGHWPELLASYLPPIKLLHGVPSSFMYMSLACQMEELELPSGLPAVDVVKKEMGGGQEGGKGCFLRRI